MCIRDRGVLYLHALGKLFHSFVFIQREQREIPAVSRLVPARIKAARYIRYSAQALKGIKPEASEMCIRDRNTSVTTTCSPSFITAAHSNVWRWRCWPEGRRRRA